VFGQASVAGDVPADDRGEDVDCRVIGDGASLGVGETPAIAGQKCVTEIGPVGPAPKGEPDKVAGPEIDAGVFEVDDTQETGAGLRAADKVADIAVRFAVTRDEQLGSQGHQVPL
jgi:hypothetical protein